MFSTKSGRNCLVFIKAHRDSVNISVWTYIPVGEQPFDHGVAVSRYPFCFQQQVEADVGAVAVAAERHE